MDLLASRVAQGAKAKSTKKSKKLTKNNSKENKEKSVSKVNSALLKKSLKKQKIKKISKEITTPKKELIKKNLIEADTNKIIKLSKDIPLNVLKIKNKKNKTTDTKKAVNNTESKTKSSQKDLKKAKPVINILKDKKLEKEIILAKKQNNEPREQKKIKKVKTKLNKKKGSVDAEENKSVILKSVKKSKSKPTTPNKVENNKEIKSIKSKKRKLSETGEKEKSKSLIPTKEEIKKYVKALSKIVEIDEKKKKSLFSAEKPPIMLQIECIKIAKTPLHQHRIVLPHSLVTSTDDVALIVKDLKRGRRRDPDDTIHHYENILQQHNCTQIKTVIPITQIKTEYRQFEMRRKLFSSYDCFLVDGRVAGHVAHLLGKEFRGKRKLPISIHMDKKDLKKEIDLALSKTCLQIHSTGNNYVVQVGNFSMSIKNITNNIMAVIHDLSKNFPGGWENIRSLRIKTPLSMAIPIYMTLKSKNAVKVPVVIPKRPKAYKEIEGELSTFTSNVNVVVAPDGTVILKNMGGETDDESESEVKDEVEDKDENAVENEDEDEENENEDQDESEDDEDE